MGKKQSRPNGTVLGSTNGTVTDDQLKRAAGEQGMVEFVKGLLLLAVKERATDIHIDPAETQVRIRFRVDGVLHDRFTLDATLLPTLTSRLKVLAGMNIAERRRPQDGRISFKLGSRSVELRASVVPAIYGEKTVLRVLSQAQFKSVPDLVAAYSAVIDMYSLRRVDFDIEGGAVARLRLLANRAAQPQPGCKKARRLLDPDSHHHIFEHAHLPKNVWRLE